MKPRDVGFCVIFFCEKVSASMTPIIQQVSYSTVVLFIGITKVRDFLP